MECFNHPHCTRVIGKPEDMAKADCVGLPVRDWVNPFGRWTTSYWRPSEEEIAALVAGGSIALHLRLGQSAHPVTSMNVYTKESENG
jgi:hypothetical protein